MIIRKLIMVTLVGTSLSAVPAAELKEDFRNPPEETKPWCYWYWLSGDITKEGISKDLESMAKVGIKRAMIGNIGDKRLNEGSVKMFSEQWYDLTRHAFEEANRLSVELMMFNGPGWSQSGGPWIKPEQSMRRVTWNEFSSNGGMFSQKVRPDGIAASQDIAVLAVPRLNAVSIEGTPASTTSPEAGPLSLAKSSWIWQAKENAAANAPAGTRYFKRVFETDPARLVSADIMITADNTYVLAVNGEQVLKDDDWKTLETASIKKYLKAGSNTIEVAVINTEASPAGLIAAVQLNSKSGKTQMLGTDRLWQASKKKSNGFKSAEVIGGENMRPWGLSKYRTKPPYGGGVLQFKHTRPFTARALVVHGKASGKLYALRKGERKLVADIHANGGSGRTDFLPNAIETFSFDEVTAAEFELVSDAGCKVVLTSEPKVAQVIEKQMGRVHPTPSPTWESYIFPDSVEPKDRSTVIQQKDIIDLTGKLKADGVLTCKLPKGNWDIIYFGMVTTGKMNTPAPPEATGLECDKMSKAHVRHHFERSIGSLMEKMTPAEKAAFKGITIDSYEVGAQNWTDGFDKEFAKRNGYSPITLLPVMTGRVINSAKKSDQFLWDLRRSIADMIAENYVGGLREVAHEHDLTLWCENYGHWGFPGEFLIYGGYSDMVGGEFWSTQNLGTIECRAASSAGHIYGKRRVYCEAFTSSLRLGHHPYLFKARGEEMFCEGINHFVLHVYAHQPRDGMPGRNPWFGTAFHRNTPWFNESRDWVKYLQRCHYMLQQGNPVADVAVYIGDFAPQMTGPENPVPAGYDYDYMGSDAILRKLDVVDGAWVVFDENDPDRITVRYKLLAIPKVKYIRPKVLERLDELKAKGGKVVHSVPVTATALQDEGITPIVSDATCAIRWKARQLDDGMIFFLSNFQNTGTFEATLRVTGKTPELFNPVTGEITKLARYKAGRNATRITIDIKDKSDSCFIVFRDKPSRPSVVGVQQSGKDIAPADLNLFYDPDNKLTAETASAGDYTLTMSDGSTREVVIDEDSQTFAIKTPWQEKKQDEEGYSVLKETTFDLPAAFGKDQRMVLDLGRVEVMAKVTLNGKTFDTLWMPPFELDVTDAVKSGRNTLTVLVTSASTGQPRLGSMVRLKTATRMTVEK
jgi:hypothetical protein